jgi:hypothetical protein
MTGNIILVGVTLRCGMLVRAQPTRHWPHTPFDRGWEKERASGGGILTRLKDGSIQCKGGLPNGLFKTASQGF